MSPRTPISPAPFAQKEGLHAALGFPITQGSEVIGVIEFFSCNARAPDEPLLQVMAIIGNQIGQFIERRQAEETLGAERSLLRTLIDNLPDHVFIKDAQGRYVLDNRAHRLFVGAASPDQVLGKTVFDLFAPELAARYAADDREILQSGKPLINREEPVTDREGQRRWLSTTKIPLRDGQEKIMVCLSRDITERKRAQETEERLRNLQEEFRVARRIQQKLFPLAAPSLPGFDIGGASYPAEATGGDYFDYFPMLDGTVGIIIADVCGHGFGPALLMASARAHFRALAQANADVGRILTLANRVITADVEDDRFITLLLARLDPATHSLVYSSAGHPPAYVLDATGAVRTHLTSLDGPLGVDPANSFLASSPIPLEPGDIVLLLTDGLLDAFSPDETPFGIDRTLDIVRSHRSQPAQEIVAALYAAARDSCAGQSQVDDITAVVLKVNEGDRKAGGTAGYTRK